MPLQLAKSRREHVGCNPVERFRQLTEASRAVEKAFDDSAPVGPIVPKAQCRIGPQTAITLEVNGVVRQQSTIGKLIWSIAEIIEHLSAAWALAPGDLIFTGTPEGVAAVGVGDELQARIDGVGTLGVEYVAR